MLNPAHLVQRGLFSGNHTCPLPKDESNLELKAEPIVGSLTLQHILAIVSHSITTLRLLDSWYPKIPRPHKTTASKSDHHPSPTYVKVVAD